VFQHNLATGTAGIVAYATSGLYAAIYDEWGLVVGGSAIGTLAFLWSIKGAAEDKRYKSVVKRLDDSEADIEASRLDRIQITEFYGKRIDEIEAKYRGQIAELEQAKLKILLELQEAHALAQRQIAADASVARTMVAVEAAAVKTAIADSAKQQGATS
jgi:hypothetical protein